MCTFACGCVSISSLVINPGSLFTSLHLKSLSSKVNCSYTLHLASGQSVEEVHIFNEGHRGSGSERFLVVFLVIPPFASVAFLVGVLLLQIGINCPIRLYDLMN